jgi:hypothetical protein
VAGLIGVFDPFPDEAFLNEGVHFVGPEEGLQ